MSAVTRGAAAQPPPTPPAAPTAPAPAAPAPAPAAPTPAAAAPAPTPAAPAAAPAPTPAAPAPAAAAPRAQDGREIGEIEAALAADARAGENATATAAPRHGGGAPPSHNPDLTIIGHFALAAFSEAEHQQTGAHDPQRSGFNLQQVELAFGAAVDPYLRFDGTLVFSMEEGVDIEEAVGTTLALGGGFQARFGQFFTRFGRLNATHPHSWDFGDQPFALGRVFGGEGSRGAGVELSYLAPLPWYVELVGTATHADGEESARSFYGEESPEVEGPRDLLYIAALKQFFPLSYDWSLSFGLSGAFGPNPTSENNRSEVYGTDLYLKYRPITRQSTTQLTLQTEWFYRRRQVPRAVLADLSGYAQVVYRFAQRWSAGGRYELGSAAHDQNGDVADDPLDPEWTRSRTRFAAQLTHYPSEFSKFRLQASRDTAFGTAVWAGFLMAELAIGPHAAHPF